MLKKIIVIVSLLGIVALTLWLRVWNQYDVIFESGVVRFTTVDAYSHMRIIDNLIYNFPHIMDVDPYWGYPMFVNMPEGTYLWHYIIAGISLLISSGVPSQGIAEAVSAWLPPIMATCVVVCVFFIGRALFNQWAGLLSAILLALFGGEFLGRSLLGHSDYHIAEVFFTTLAILCLVVALKIGEKLERKKDALKIIALAVTSGLFVGFYSLTWTGFLLIIFIFVVYFIIQLIIGHLQSNNIDHIILIALPLLATASVFSKFGSFSLWMIVISLVVLFWLWLLTYIKNKHGYFKGFHYVVVVVITSAIGVIVAFIIAPDTIKYAFNIGTSMFTWYVGTATSEEMPLLLDSGKFTLGVAWQNFGMAFYLALFAVGIMAYRSIKRNEHSKLFLVIWFLLLIGNTLAMRRFCYYLAVPTALLTGYGCWLIIDFVHRKQRWVTHGLIVVLFFVVMFVPLYRVAEITSKQHGEINNAWNEALTWLKDNTDEPFGSEQYYYELYDGMKQPDYTVMSWWDYGYWISREARRVPVSSPGGGARDLAGWYFANINAKEAEEVIKRAKARYIVIDYEMIMRKFYAMPLYAYKFEHLSMPPEDYQESYEICYDLKMGKYKPQQLWYENYYKSMVVNLFSFNGRGFQSKGTPVFEYDDSKGFREVTKIYSFPSQEEAYQFIEQQGGNKIIAGTDPFLSPVDIQPLMNYKLVFQSKAGIKSHFITDHAHPYVKIFEYTGKQN